MKETEKEVIEINLEGEMNYFLIKDLEKCIANLYARKATQLEQLKFLESALKKCKEKKPRFFSARECSTLEGYLESGFELTKNSKFKVMAIIFKNALTEWEKNNPNIN